jgi:AcrR family transcriptional regulator
MTTRELAERLDGVPKSSIYRHMRALLAGSLVEVAETRPVKGTLEKFYRLEEAPRLSQADLAGFSRQDHQRYFAMFLASQLQGFSSYLEARPDPDFQADRVGYSQGSIYVDLEELDRLLSGIRREISKHGLKTKSAAGRRRQMIAIITYPLKQGDEENG